MVKYLPHEADIGAPKSRYGCISDSQADELFNELVGILTKDEWERAILYLPKVRYKSKVIAQPEIPMAYSWTGEWGFWVRPRLDMVDGKESMLLDVDQAYIGRHWGVKWRELSIPLPEFIIKIGNVYGELSEKAIQQMYTAANVTYAGYREHTKIFMEQTAYD